MTHELDSMQDYEDEAYEEELRCGSCGGFVHECLIGDETYYRCEDCGLGDAK